MKAKCINAENAPSSSNSTLQKKHQEDEFSMKERCGSCYCGKVTIKVKGKPKSVSICHCTICQRLCGSPFSIQSLHDPQNVSITLKNNDDNNTNNEPWSSSSSSSSWWSIQTSNHVKRHRCSDCGSPLYATLSLGGKKKASIVWEIPRTMLFQSNENIDDDYNPTHHMYYASRIMDYPDDLPKYIGTSHPSRRVEWKEEG